MGKKATKAADNMYYLSRSEAAEDNADLASRESASEKLHIERTRLANIELGNIAPYPEEVKSMAEVYNKPELCNWYCANECPIGKGTVSEIKMDDFDRISLRVLGSLKDIDTIRTELIDISEDGIVTAEEEATFNKIIDSLDKIADSATALKLWAKKNIEIKK